MAHSFAFEKLEVWKESRKLTSHIYLLTQNFPDTEKFGLINQMRRASISVCSNIAEGSSRGTAKDQAHLYQIAYSSMMELLSQLIISHDLRYLNEEAIISIRVEIEKIANMLNALRKNRISNIQTTKRFNN